MINSIGKIFNKFIHRKHSRSLIYEQPLIQICPGSSVVVLSEKTVVQEVDTSPYEVAGISLLFATFMRENDCKVQILIYSEFNKLIHHETFDAKRLADNVYYTVNFKDNLIYKGKLYICVNSPNSDRNNYVALWTEVGIVEDGLFIIPYLSVKSLFSKDKLLKTKQCSGVILATQIKRAQSKYMLRSYLKHGLSDISPTQDRPKMTCLAICGFDCQRLNLFHLLNKSNQFTITEIDEHNFAWDDACQALLLPAEMETIKAKKFARFARKKSIPIFALTDNVALCDDKAVLAWPSYLDGIIMNNARHDVILPYAILNDDFKSSFVKLYDAYIKRKRPVASIVTILKGKSEHLKYVIQSYFNQDYQGDIEIIYINDCFGDAECIVKKEFELNLRRVDTRIIKYKILRNEKNLGNCISRNRGIAASTGDIIIIVDDDCMLNRRFVTAHVDAHAYFDCEVVIGPHNIESHGIQPWLKINELEENPTAPLAESQLQDDIFLDSFLNCITRNFSIKKSAIIEDLFDPCFSYSLDPESGFGWEDIEMGYRLYKRGVGVKFTEDAFSVHISHSSLVSEEAKPQKSIRNFRKLFLKHPELRDVVRRWSVRTLDLLDEWSHRIDPCHQENEELHDVKRLFIDAPRPVVVSKKLRHKLRILTYRWHVPHQYELYKSGHDFFLVKGTGSPMCDQWDYGQRPLPANANFINIEDVRVSEFDMALLHFDENVLNYENTNGKIGLEWGAAFRYFVENVNLPKVAICHGTPQFYGQYTPDYDKPDLMSVIDPARKALVDYVKDIDIVCNSYQAQQEWGFHKSRVIWHGFDPSEFLPGTYTKGILSPLGPLVKSRPHYRGFYLYKKVISTKFPQSFLPETLSVPDPDIDYADNVFAIAKYKNYINTIRKYSVYFNPTLRSPMPRSRGEAMMCGVVTVNANNHDVDIFLKNGINGFYSNDPEELRDYLIYLMEHPEMTKKIGAKARETAINIFNYDRFLYDWSMLFRSVV